MIKARKRKELLRKTIIYTGLVLFALFVLVPLCDHADLLFEA